MRFVTPVIALLCVCTFAECCCGRRKRTAAPEKSDIRIAWRLEGAGSVTRSTLPVGGTKILWIRIAEDRGLFRCSVATDAGTYTTTYRFPRPEKIVCEVAYDPSVKQRAKTITGMWCLAPEDITLQMIKEFQTEKGGYVIPGDVARVEIEFQKGRGVKIHSRLTSTYASWFSCGWWPGFVVMVLYKEP